MNNVFTRLSLLLTILLFTQACTTTNSALNPEEPHVYLNSYQEVIDAVDKSLTKSSMKVYDAKEIDSDSYYIKYYKEKFDTGNKGINPNSALMAEIIIKKSGDKSTTLTINEEEQSTMIPSEYREKLGRNVLRELNKLLIHESEATKTLANNDE